MNTDYIKCELIGTISSKPKVIPQKNNLKLISFKINISTFNERVIVKIFDIDDNKINEFGNTFALGDKVKIIGEIKCDAFINKERLVKGLRVVPTTIELLEKGDFKETKDFEIIK